MKTMKHNSGPLMLFADDFLEHRNIAWRVEQGEPDPKNPLLEPAYPWDSAATFNCGTVLKDPIDGLWKCWGQVFPHVDNFVCGQFYNRLAYAFSEDGVNWTRPMLEGFPCLGRQQSNVLMDIEKFGKVGSASVIVRPDVEPDKQYEMFVALYPGYGRPEGRVLKGFPLAAGQGGHPGGIYRFFSPDGIHWNPQEGPLNLKTADSIYFHRQPDGSYLAYHKVGIKAPPGGFVPYDVGAGEERILVRRESPNGSDWSLFELQVMPDWRDSHDTQFMDLVPLRQGSGYVGVVAVYHALNQMMDFQFAGSRDGKEWFRPFPRVATLSTVPLGDSGGVLLYSAKDLVEEGDRLYLYYSAMSGLHGDLYGKTSDEYLQYGSLCRASWKKGRLWSAVPAASGPTEGILTTWLVDTGGRNLYVNGITADDGEISAALYHLREAYTIEEALEPIPGFSRAECQLFRGDSQAAVITWKGADRCPVEKACVRFYIRKARLHGYEWA